MILNIDMSSKNEWNKSSIGLTADAARPWEVRHSYKSRQKQNSLAFGQRVWAANWGCERPCFLDGSTLRPLRRAARGFESKLLTFTLARVAR